MHSMDIMYSGDYHGGGTELFTVQHSGDFSGDVIINLEQPRVVKLVGSGVHEVTIPFEVLARIVAEKIRGDEIAEYEQMDWKTILGVT
jgi:hypothetical protein